MFGGAPYGGAPWGGEETDQQIADPVALDVIVTIGWAPPVVDSELE